MAKRQPPTIRLPQQKAEVSINLVLALSLFFLIILPLIVLALIVLALIVLIFIVLALIPPRVAIFKDPKQDDAQKTEFCWSEPAQRSSC